jgi:exosome complex component RRP40
MTGIKEKVNKVVIPGETVGQVEFVGIKLGVGLIQDKGDIVATKAGILRCKNPDTYFIENSQKRYVPSLDDLVIGKVEQKQKDIYKVDIGCHESATLSAFSIEGGNKKNRLNLAIGGLVYCRVSVASRDMEPEIECLSSHGKKDGFGPLTDGYMFQCSTGLARDCLAEDSYVLNELGKTFAYEIAVGINGRIWVNSTSTINTILLSNAIQNSACLTNEQISEMISSLVKVNNSNNSKNATTTTTTTTTAATINATANTTMAAKSTKPASTSYRK